MQPVLVSGVSFPVISGNILFPLLPRDDGEKGSPDRREDSFSVNAIVMFLPICKLTGLANFEKILPTELHAHFLPSAVQVSSFYFLHSPVKY